MQTPQRAPPPNPPTPPHTHLQTLQRSQRQVSVPKYHVRLAHARVSNRVRPQCPPQHLLTQAAEHWLHRRGGCGVDGAVRAVATYRAQAVHHACQQRVVRVHIGRAPRRPAVRVLRCSRNSKRWNGPARPQQPCGDGRSNHAVTAPPKCPPSRTPARTKRPWLSTHCSKRHCQIRPEQIRPEQIRPEQIRPEQIRSEQIRSEQIRPEQIRPEQIRPEKSMLRCYRRTLASFTGLPASLTTTKRPPGSRSTHACAQRHRGLGALSARN
eukprot:360889-Chlamydomonas_euryale.AAC.4